MWGCAGVLERALVLSTTEPGSAVVLALCGPFYNERLAGKGIVYG